MILVAAALAGSLYINGIKVENPPVATLESVTVRFDEEGNIYVEAPQYAVAVVSRERMVPTPSVGKATPASTPTAAAPAPAAVPSGVWWLVVEDGGSTAQQVDIAVNGAFVVRVRSGEAQRVMDLAGYLKPGKNTVVLQAAPSPGSTGTLKIYVGRGRDTGGAIEISDPVVRYVRAAGEGDAGGTLAYTVSVQ